jgi:hypothetical protein
MAIFMVLAVVVIASMLGYMGLTLASSDAKLAGGVMDARSRDAAGRSGMQLALNAMSENPANAALQLNQFIADSGLAVVSAHQWLNFSNSPFTLDVNEPDWFAIDSGANLSAVKVRILSVDIGNLSGAPTDGVKITFECIARGRSGDQVTLASTYKALGLQVPVQASNTPTNNFALYLNGALANSNMGAEVHGNVYINGSTSLNGPASFNVTGKLRVNGDFNSNAPITVSENAVIAGNIYTNGSAAMTFAKNLVIKGGTQAIQSALSVAGNLEINGSSGGSWNSPVTVGGQFWSKTECEDIGSRVTVGGNAFFDACLRLTGSGNSFSNLYVGRAGGNRTDYINGGTTILGRLGSWHTSPWGWSGWDWRYLNTFGFTGSTVTVGGDALFHGHVEQNNSGKVTVSSSAQFLSGIGNINSSGGLTVVGRTYLYNGRPQQNEGNGYLDLGNDFTMAGDADPNFCRWGTRWRFFGASKVWKYEANAAFVDAPSPRVINAATDNAASWNAPGSLPVPAALFAAPVPMDPLDYPTDPYTANDLDLGSNKTWNQPQTSDFTTISGVVDLDATNLTAAGAATSNLTATDFQKIYNKFKRADGWMVVRIGAGSPIGSLNPPGGTFTGKALWIIEQGVNVNGNWPPSATTSDLQFIWVRSGGSLASFGSPGNFAGYIRFEPTFSGQMSWGGTTPQDTLTGAIHFVGGGSSVTGNGCNKLVIKNSQAVFDAIAQAFPGVLSDPSGSASGGGATSTNKLQARQSALQFVPVGEYR